MRTFGRQSSLQNDAQHNDIKNCSTEQMILYHLAKSQLVKYLGWKSVAHIPSPNLPFIPSIEDNITDSDVSMNWWFHYMLAKRHYTNKRLTK